MPRRSKKADAKDSGARLQSALNHLLQDAPAVPAADPTPPAVLIEPAIRVLDALRIAKQDAATQGRKDLAAELEDLEARLGDWCEHNGFTLAQTLQEPDEA